jgi:hypothetical protein
LSISLQSTDDAAATNVQVRQMDSENNGEDQQAAVDNVDTLEGKTIQMPL